MIKYFNRLHSKMASKKPKLIAFDLDYTLWPFWVDTHPNPPFHLRADGEVFDSCNHKVKYYPEVPKILKKLKKEGFIIAIASRTSEIDGANELLKLFGWNKYITYKEIYPGSKVKHFKNFKKQSGVEFQDMLFFDDEYRNIEELSKEGVVCVLVRDGVNTKVVEEGLKEYVNHSN